MALPLSLFVVGMSTLQMAHAQVVPASALASQFGLATSTSLPFPTATLANSDAQNFIVGAGWGLSKGRIQNGADRIAFVDDPFPSGSSSARSASSSSRASSGSGSGPVLQVLYPANVFESQDSGMQLETLWNTSSPSQSMLLSYEVAFDTGFDWVKGGKMAGLRGGPNSTGCSGGNKPNGTNCFSARTMWRTAGAGEVYAYIPTPNNLCSDSDIICNSDFGTSIDRGSFSFAAGQWNTITLLVQMNDPVNVANGNVELYYNDVQALKKSNLQFRSSSVVNINGLYLSTFFGGDDSSWAPPSDAHSYFRNFQLWAGSAPSNATGSSVSTATRVSSRLGIAALVMAAVISSIALY